MAMTKAIRRTLGVIAVVACAVSWYIASSLSATGDNKDMLVGGVCIVASIGVFCAACWLGGFYDG